MKKGLILSFFFICCSCTDFMSQPVLGRQSIDQCNFHIGQMGNGLRWSSLPVPLTIHQNSVNQSAISTILKVVEEWNQIWSRESGQKVGLFEVLGLIEYPHVLNVMNDNENTITFVHAEQNQSPDGYSIHSQNKFLQSHKQGVTHVRGRGHMVEADVFINEDDFDFFYEDQDYLTQRSSSSRNLASLEEKKSFFENIKNFFNFLFFWKKKSEERIPASRKQIPSQLIDFESLVTHELGHVLGLGHNEKRGSIMNSYLARGSLRRGLRPIELESLLCGYGNRQKNETF